MTAAEALGPMHSVALTPITKPDLPRVATFLHNNLNHRVTERAWEQLMTPSWDPDPPNHGFLLSHADAVVGAYVAVYSRRTVDASVVSVCNLAAFCVLPDHRAHSLRLVRKMLAQRGYVFTDLSPSGNVPALNDRLGFTRWDTATRLVTNLPCRARRDVAVLERKADIAEILAEADARVFEDHQDAAAARHLVVQTDEGYGYLIYRRDRRRRLPLFASPLYVGGSAEILADAWPSVAGVLLRRGLTFTLGERRILGFVPSGPGRDLRDPRPKMYKGSPDSAPKDYLYSELVLLQW